MKYLKKLLVAFAAVVVAQAQRDIEDLTQLRDSRISLYAKNCMEYEEYRNEHHCGNYGECQLQNLRQ